MIINWIREKIIENNFNKSDVYLLWEDFKKETNSNMNRESFKTQVKKECKKIAENIKNGNESVNIDKKVGFIDHGNWAEAISNGSSRIRSVEDLIKELKIDLNIWKYEEQTINKWDAYRKKKYIDMAWNEGKVTGSVRDDGEINIQPMFAVRVKFVRRVPVRIEFPPLQQIVINSSIPIESIEKKVVPNSLKKCIVISDAQMGFKRDFRTGHLRPFHDRRILDIILQAIIISQPDLILYLGDMFDLTDWSDKFATSPDHKQNLMPSLLEFSWWDAMFRKACPSAKRLFIPGNHEARMYKSIIVNQASAYGLKKIDNIDGFDALSIPNLLNVENTGLEWVDKKYPKGRFWLNSFTCASHGHIVRKGSGATAMSIVKTALHSEILGHTHRVEIVAKTPDSLEEDRAPIIIASFGTTAFIDGRVPSYGGYENWQQAFGYVYYNDTCFNPIPIFVDEGKALFEGNILEGEDYSVKIAKDVSWPAIEWEE